MFAFVSVELYPWNVYLSLDYCSTIAAIGFVAAKLNDLPCIGAFPAEARAVVRTRGLFLRVNLPDASVNSLDQNVSDTLRTAA